VDEWGTLASILLLLARRGMIPYALLQVDPTPPGGVPPAQYVESSQESPDAPSSPFTGLTLILHALPLLAQTHGMNRSEKAHGILEEHVRQLSDSRNGLSDNSNESYVNWSGSTILYTVSLENCSHRKSPFQVRMILMEFTHGC